MAEKSTIEWTDATWNPITGCTLVDEGCRNCYAADLAASRLSSHPSRAGLARRNAAGVSAFTGEVRFNEQWLDQPLHWRRPRMIFVCAHGDLFHEAVPNEWIDRVFAVMALAPQHTFQVLTKRPERARKYLSRIRGNEDRCRDIIEAARKSGGLIGDMPKLRDSLAYFPLPNVWLGTSASDQTSADKRVPELLAVPAAVRFLSAEPLLGPMDLRFLQPGEPPVEIDAVNGTHGVLRPHQGRSAALDWVIAGGESGRRARPMHPDWARGLRDQCVAARVPFFFKQWGEYAPYPKSAAGRDQFSDHSFGVEVVAMFKTGKKISGRLLDGREWSQMPWDRQPKSKRSA